MIRFGLALVVGQSVFGGAYPFTAEKWPGLTGLGIAICAALGCVAAIYAREIRLLGREVEQ